MNEQVVKLLIYIGVALALMGVGAAGAWMWQENCYETIIAKNEVSHQADLTAISNAATAQVRSDQDKRLVLEQKLSASEQSHYKELSDAQTNQARLHDRLATSDLRLSILLDAADSASGCAVPAGAATVSVVHGEARVRLDPAHAQRIIAITDAGDRGLIALAACQAYAKAVSTPK